MEEKHLLVLIIAIVNVVILFVLWALVRNPNKKSTSNSKRTESDIEKKKRQIHVIEQLVDIAANRNSTRNDLANAVMKVSQSFPFPPKIKGKVTNEGKVYLNFVLLIASHKNADAKLVAFMNTELKKRNETYGKEIDIYENEGLNQRGARV